MRDVFNVNDIAVLLCKWQ